MQIKTKLALLMLLIMGTSCLYVAFYQNYSATANTSLSVQQNQPKTSITTNTLTTFGAISISSNSNFASQASTNSWPGDGSSGNPFIIENYNITTSASSTSAIAITSTSVYFIIRNCYTSATGVNDNGIYLNNVTNGIITNNTITKNNVYGLSFSTVSNTTISNNLIENNIYWGIYDAIGNNNTYTNNVIINNNSDGVWLAQSLKIYVNANTIRFNAGDGLYFGVTGPSGHIVVTNNVISNNTKEGISADLASNDIISHNIIANNSYNGINVGTNNANNTIWDNRISTNSLNGIFIDGSSNNVSVLANLISGNTLDGINMSSTLIDHYASNSTISNNTISQNKRQGIEINENNNNTIVNNIITNNLNYGIKLINGTENKIYLNTLIQNNIGQKQGYANNISNSWTNGYFGNYWSDYTGVDTNNDGIGDSNYTLDGGLKVNDTLPLMYAEIFSVAKVADITYSEGTTNHAINWVINGYGFISYTVYKNGSQITTGSNSSQLSNKQIFQPINGLSMGIYNYTLVVEDTSISLMTNTSVIVTVRDTTPPVLTASVTTLSYKAGTTGHEITINASDLHPSSYIVYKNGTNIASGSWNSSVSITVSVDGLAVGTYNFTIVVYDISNNHAQVSILITVTPSSNNGGSSPSFEVLTTVIGLLAIVGYVTIVRRNKKE